MHKSGSPAPAEDLSSLVPEVLRLLRTEKIISVSLLQEKFRIGFARASALYQLVSEQEIIDKAGRPTATTKARLATKDLGSIFECPFCEHAEVHHYQTQRRLLPDTHFFKCPECLTEFEQTDETLYKLVQVPEKYAAIGNYYKNRSFTPAQWKLIKKAEKVDQ
jgi:DNA-directed RNA polymerase subunit M/transcription elongation factor TFIIS